MSYLIINEGLKTIAHNLWTRPVFGTTQFTASGVNASSSGGAGAASLYMMRMAANKLGIAIALAPSLLSMLVNHFTHGPVAIDIKYFDSMYTISNNLKKKLQEWLKQAKATQFTQKQVDTNPHHDSENKNYLPASKTYLANNPVGKKSFTTVTIPKKIQGPKGFYIVFFTFDDDSIKDAKALVFNGREPWLPRNYTVKSLQQWRSVKPEEYKK